MKKFLLNVLLAASSLIAAPAVHADNSYTPGIFNHLGIGAHASTTGFGVELGTPVTPFVTIRGGVSIMPGFNFTTSVDGSVDAAIAGHQGSYPFSMDVKGDLRRVQGSLIANVYPFGTQNAFFISAGAYFGGSKVIDITGHTDEIKNIPGYQLGAANISIGDYEIPVDRDGNVNGMLKVNSFRPYLGLGYGRAVPSGRINFGVELGVQFMGSMRPYVGSEKLDQVIADSDDDWQKWMDKVNVYPVLKFTISGRIF